MGPYGRKVDKIVRLDVFGGLKRFHLWIYGIAEKLLKKTISTILKLFNPTLSNDRQGIFLIPPLYLIASHVGVYEINPDPYNLKDWELKRIAESGGVIGVIFMNFWLMPRESQRGLNFITRTIDHVVNTAGIDHVGIGSDFNGFTDPPDDLKDYSEMPVLTQRLLAAGYSAVDIHKILGGNALRVLKEGWKR